jgi:hypothetical protein
MKGTRMSEPVGNQPRKRTESLGDIAGISGNSHKDREAAADKTVEREPVEKIVTGVVVSRKTPWWKRVGRSMLADDVGNVGDYILTDVIVPATKNLIVDMIGQSIERMLFGTSRGRVRRPVGLGLRDSVRYDRVREDPREPRRLMSQSARARHDFNEIVLANRTEAVDVVTALVELIVKYGAATVTDLYDLVGTTGSYADQRWGWTDLATADVRQVSGGFLLDLPAPELIR